MSYSVVSNVAAQSAQTSISRNQDLLSQSMQRLTASLKLNRGADGPATLVQQSPAASSGGSQVGSATSTTISSEAKSRFSALTSGSGAQSSPDLSAQASITSLATATSRIRDADIASEATNLSKYQVQRQSGIAALAQANQSSQSVLSLLRG